MQKIRIDLKMPTGIRDAIKWFACLLLMPSGCGTQEQTSQRQATLGCLTDTPKSKHIFSVWFLCVVFRANRLFDELRIYQTFAHL